MVVLGDLNARVGNESMMDRIGKYGVPGRNDSGNELIGLCIEREILVGNTCFKKKDINKYTWDRVGKCIVIDRALMDYLLISKKC